MSWAQVAGWIGDRWEWINDYGTAVGAVAGVVAAIVAMLALASAASDSKARSQPRVTAEFRPAAESDVTMDLVITNMGSTPARDVVVTFDPPLDVPEDDSRLVAPFIVRRYSKPIPVLNPQQYLTNIWWAGEPGPGNELVNREPTPDDVTVTVSYRGVGRKRLTEQFPLTFETVSLTTYSVSSTSLHGRLKTIDQSLTKLEKAVTKIAARTAKEPRTAEIQRSPAQPSARAVRRWPWLRALRLGRTVPGRRSTTGRTGL